MKTVTLILLLLLSSLLIVSCHGGGGGSGAPPVSGGGKVIDGYVQGAWVYIVPVGETTSAHALYTSDVPTSSQGNFTFSGNQAFI